MADKNTERILVDRDLRPAYYDDFHCLTAGCRYNCCKFDWNITFNKKDYLVLRQQKCSKELQANLDQALSRIKPPEEEMYGKFTLRNGACPLLSEEGMCTLQMEKGFQTLPTVCRDFPRKILYSASGYLERSLSPACEGVLQLLWDLPDGIDFRSDPLEKTKCKWAVFGPDSLQPAYKMIRELCIDFLQDRRFSLPERILMMGMALRLLAEGEMPTEQWIEHAQAIPESAQAGDLLRTAAEGERTLPIFLSSNLRILAPLPDSADSTPLKRELILALGVSDAGGPGTIRGDQAPYLDARQRYGEVFDQRSYFMENLMVTLFFHLHLPDAASAETLWKSYVAFCNLYAFVRFMAVMSCREGVEDYKAELFRAMVIASRSLVHNGRYQSTLRDEFFQNDSATLAHMAILLSC